MSNDSIKKIEQNFIKGEIMKEPMTKHVCVCPGASMPILNPQHEHGLEWQLRYRDPVQVRYVAASVVSSYEYLLSGNITTKEAIRRLRILRGAYKEAQKD